VMMLFMLFDQMDSKALGCGTPSVVMAQLTDLKDSDGRSCFNYYNAKSQIKILTIPFPTQFVSRYTVLAITAYSCIRLSCLQSQLVNHQ
jgi:hypothetical protein